MLWKIFINILIIPFFPYYLVKDYISNRKIKKEFSVTHYNIK